MTIFERNPVRNQYFLCRKDGHFEPIQGAQPIKLSLFGQKMECVLHRSSDGKGFMVTEQYTGKQIAYHPGTKKMAIQEALAKITFFEILHPESSVSELFTGKLTPRYA